MIEPLATQQPPTLGALHDDAFPRSVRDTSDIDRLGDQIAELSAQIQAATYHLLVLIREFDAQDGWNTGFRSCAHWLNWRTGLALGAAREKVRVARALGDLPLLSEAMRRGELSYSKVRALTRVATAEIEEELLEFARAGTATHVETLVRAWRRVDRNEQQELEHEELRRASRYLQSYTDEDGMVVLRARLEPEAGAAVLKALEAAEEVLYDVERETKDAQGDGVSAPQRRADALGLVAERALASGLDGGARGDHLQVVVHVDAEVLEDPQQPGVSMLEDGTRVPAGTSRRLACDAGKVVMIHDSEGKILDVGLRRRTIPTAIRRALSYRDESCRFPGCGVKYCEAHHLKHWANGGKTSLENLVLLCRRHHRSVHEEGFRVECVSEGEFRFFDPKGRDIPALPPPVALGRDPLEALSARLSACGVSIDSETGFPSWQGESWDLGWAIHAYRRLGRADSDS